MFHSHLASSFLPPTVPTSPPLDVRATLLGSGNVEITWSPPVNSTVTGYHVLYQRVDNTNSTGPGSEESVTVFNTSATIRGLIASATYNISVVAFSNLPTTRSPPINVTLTGMEQG